MEKMLDGGGNCGLPSLSIPTSMGSIASEGLAEILKCYWTPVNNKDLGIYGETTPKDVENINPSFGILQKPHAIPETSFAARFLNSQQQPTLSSPITTPILYSPQLPNIFPSPTSSGIIIENMGGLTIDLPNNQSPSDEIQEYNNNQESRENSVFSTTSLPSRKNSDSSAAGNETRRKPRRSSPEKYQRRKEGNTASQARARAHNKIIKDCYESNDKLIEYVSKLYLQSEHRDPILTKLIKDYQFVPKKERPYKKRT